MRRLGLENLESYGFKCDKDMQNKLLFFDRIQIFILVSD